MIPPFLYSALQKSLNIWYVHVHTMIKIEINKGNLVIKDRVIGFFKKIVTKYGNGAKVDCPKKYLDKEAYLIIVR